MTQTPDPFPWETPTTVETDGPTDESPPRGIDELIRDTSREVEQRRETIELGSVIDDLAGDPLALSTYTAAAKTRVAAAVRARAASRFDLRPETVESKSDLRRELVGAADDFDVLTALADVFTHGAKLAKGIAGDLLDELPKRGGKPARSTRVGDGQGFELHVVVSPNSKTVAEYDEIVDVLAARAAGNMPEAVGDPSDGPTVAVYVCGFRDGIDALRSVLAASPAVKSTALDKLVTELENANEDDLARRLRKAYGRRDVGEPAVKIERKPMTNDADAVVAEAEQAGAEK